MPKIFVSATDDSMFCLTAKVHIPKGAELLIDTQATPAPNKIIAAVNTLTGETLIRLFDVFSGKKYLTPLNNHYTRIELTESYEILGVAVTVYQNL